MEELLNYLGELGRISETFPPWRRSETVEGLIEVVKRGPSFASDFVGTNSHGVGGSISL